MKGSRIWIASVVAAAIVLAALLLVRTREVPTVATSRAGLQLTEALAGDTTGYAKALAPRAFEFPRDHAAHDDYKIEWWYFTGNLTSADGRDYGYQFTIFRSALQPPSATPAEETGWESDQLYFAHLAVSDIASGSFSSFEKFSRGAAGLAGTRAQAFSVWVEDWSVESIDEAPAGSPATAPSDIFPLRLQAASGDVDVDLTINSAKPIVLQGDRGFSRKGGGIGQASYYYSFTSLPTTGSITISGRSASVSGKSWMDREWSTSLLDEGQVGWDWFSLQLDNSNELMFFRLRDEAGSAAWSDGTLVGTDGSSRHFNTESVVVQPVETWTSPRTGATYPTSWRLQIPDLDADLEVTAALPHQELDVSVTYWEGSVRVDGVLSGQEVGGRGYVELTGY